MFDNKKHAEMILKKMDVQPIKTELLDPSAPEPMTSAGQPEEAEPKMGLHSAADDIMTAFHAKDSSALADGLHAFFEMCQGNSYGDDE